jgi:uncharacterized protein YndB with AHSA1/START domain
MTIFHTLNAPANKQEIVITSLLDAPRELVWKFYGDPKWIPQWLGPTRLTTTVTQMDMRPGGSWRFVQRDAEGNEFAFHGVYHEVNEPERLVMTFEFEGAPGHVLLETVTFKEENGKTRLIDQSVFQSLDDRDGMLNSGMEAGSAESMERLAKLLSKQADK